jgi:aspartate aminotransferase-like enzyme
LSLASVSEKAKRRGAGIERRGYYFDMLLLLEYVEERNFQYPSTPSISHTYALDFSLDRILKQEGLEARFARHREMADYVRAWTKEHFALFPKEEYASDTVTCISNTRQISVKDLNAKLGERGFMISNGYGALKEKTFRIAHMAELHKQDLEELLGHIEDILGLSG